MNSNSFDRVRAHALIDKERDAQDKQWGGPDHDDQHTFRDWLNFIDKQLTLTSPKNASRRFIKIAALAVAAWESIQRKKEQEREHPNRSNHA